MTRSANEVAGLATKAALGAGAPPAQAALFGRAAAVHLAAARDPQALEAALAALPAGPVIEVPVALLRLAETAKPGPISGVAPALLQSYLAALPYQATLSAQGTVQLDLATPAAPIAAARLTLPAPLAARWSALAARLLVPETAASRSRGAGAGLSDND